MLCLLEFLKERTERNDYAFIKRDLLNWITENDSGNANNSCLTLERPRI